MSDDPTDKGLAPDRIARCIDDSLRRLQVDHVDLYQAHRFDVDVPVEDTVEALAKVVEQGKARYLGFSEWTPEQIRAGIEVGGEELFVSSQPQYSMLWQAPEAEVLELCAAHGIGQIVWSPLAQGLLTGKYRLGQPAPEGSRFATESMSVSRDLVWSDETLGAVERLLPVAEQAGMSLATLALAWVLRRPEITSAIVGASRPQQVFDNAAASGVTLGDDVLAAIDEALGDVPVTEPTLAPNARAGVRHRDQG
jgi:aryl-alcohol dehydrogenase-like predicted oxidoreductase